MKATVEELRKLPDIGTIIANVLDTNKEHIRSFFGTLAVVGVEVQYPIGQNANRPYVEGITGKTFVITGSFPETRDVYKAQLESMGAKVSSAVSSKTDFLLCGENPGSKLTKATALNIPVVSLSYLQNIL